MKKNQFIFWVLFMVVGLFAPMGCESNIEPEEQQKLEGPIMLTMEGFASQTKTSVNGTSTVWENGDEVTLNGNPYTVTVNGSDASVNATNINVDDPIYGYYGCAPISNGQTTAPTVTIPASYSCSFNGDGRQIIALPMAAYTAAANNNITFKHLTAAVEVKIWNATASTLYVDAVTVTAETSRLNGNLTLDFTAADFGITSDNTSVPEANRIVTVTFPTPLEIATGETAAKSIQIPILPIAADNLTINVSSYNADIAGVPVTGLTHIFNHTASSAALGRNVMLSAKVKMSPQSTKVTSKGTFSVSNTKAVYFSKGNLQATASGVTATSASWTYGFAYPQYSFVGGSHSDPLGEDFTPTGNNYITGQEPWMSQNGTVDLFSWVSQKAYKSYITGGVAEYGICNFGVNSWSLYGSGEDLMHDWGSLVGENWFTLSKDEWKYLLSYRGEAGYAACSSLTEGTTSEVARYLKTTITDVAGAEVCCGLVIFPDDFTWPADVAMKPGLVTWQDTAPKLNHHGMSYKNGTTYKIAVDDWHYFEEAGCVFLPAAGYRDTNLVGDFSGGPEVVTYGPIGRYWTSTCPDGSSYAATALEFSSSGLNIVDSPSSGRNEQGKSVRLVYPAN